MGERVTQAQSKVYQNGLESSKFMKLPYDQNSIGIQF